MLKRKVDLHSHTNHSDGYYSPEELVYKAKDVGIDILSITDHDSTNAIEKATKIGRELGVEIIPGVEISSDISGVEVHILGYFIDITNKELEHYLKFFREERIRRANNIVRKLNHLGLDISMADVMLLSKN